MKTPLLSTFVILALIIPSFAEEEMHLPKEGETACAVCYKDREWQLSLFYSFSNHPTNGGFGGGVGLDYFFHRYVGIGVEGNWFPGGEKDAVITQAIGNVFLRYPVELDGGHFAVAPYLFGGAGGLWDNKRSAGEGHIGIGLEGRFSEHWGIFADIRNAWTSYPGAGADIVEFRSGLRVLF